MPEPCSDHISASPDDRPIRWSEERQSRVSEANRAATPQAPWTAETKTKQSHSGEAETPTTDQRKGGAAAPEKEG